MTPKTPKCFTCRAELKEHKYNDCKYFENCTIIIRDIPCEKCTACGEIAYDFWADLRIEEIVKTLKPSIDGKIAEVQYSEEENVNVTLYKNVDTEAVTIAQPLAA